MSFHSNHLDRLTRFSMMLQIILGAAGLVSTTASSLPGKASYVAAPGFPTSAFSSYYDSPALPTKEPQPIIYDPILNYTFPYELTNPDSIPERKIDELMFPPTQGRIVPDNQTGFIEAVRANVTNILKGSSFKSQCDKCKKALSAAKPAALLTPHMVPEAMVSLCEGFSFGSKQKCEEQFAANTFGPIWTQVLAYADVEGLDGQYICYHLNKTYCPQPQTRPLNTSGLFPKAKPANAHAPKANGQRIKVLHLSDLHLDPRYAVSSEANCSSNLCCRSDNHNTYSKNKTLLPASPYGYFKCDTPYDLALAALQAVGPLTGTGKDSNASRLAWTLYTGDLASHDPEAQISHEYLEYTETSIFAMFKEYLTGPVFVTLGNHDSAPSNIDSPHKLPGRLGEQSTWNYEHVAGLWQHEGWISNRTAEEAETHYGGYSIKTHYGLRIISFNTDFWYQNNILNFIDTENPDNSGMMRWMINELQKAEDAGERVWIIGHVLSGWDGYNPLPNPTDLFYQIVDRYSPHVIANTFWGHNHEDQFMIYYANNGTVKNSKTALSTGWIVPSVTPLTNLNSGFRLYEVDTGDFNIYQAYTFFSNVSDYSRLNKTGPTYQFEYSTRDTYGPAAGWDKHAPLNATFWHRVTEAMEHNIDLVTRQNALQGKLSVKSPVCNTTACQRAKICYMRSASAGLGYLCPQGYGSVQSPFTAKEK